MILYQNLPLSISIDDNSRGYIAFFQLYYIIKHWFCISCLDFVIKTFENAFESHCTFFVCTCLDVCDGLHILISVTSGPGSSGATDKFVKHKSLAMSCISLVLMISINAVFHSWKKDITIVILFPKIIFYVNDKNTLRYAYILLRRKTLVM